MNVRRVAFGFAVFSLSTVACAGSAPPPTAPTPPTPPPTTVSVAVMTVAPPPAPVADQKTYTMADLELLEKSGRWAELLEHIEDVRPAQRTEAWHTLLEKSANLYLASLPKGPGMWRAFFAGEALVERHPGLIRNPTFFEQRITVANAAFAQCLAESSTGGECIAAMRAFLSVGTPPPEVPFTFGKLVRAKLNHYLAMPFFALALANRPASKQQCADADLRMAIESAASMPKDSEEARAAEQVRSACKLSR